MNQERELYQQIDDKVEAAREMAEVKSRLDHILEGMQRVQEQIALLFTMSRDMAAVVQRQEDHNESIRRLHERQDATDKAILHVDQFASRWVNRAVGGWVIGGLLLGLIQALVWDRVKTYEAVQAAQVLRVEAIDRRVSRIEYTKFKEEEKER